jgi:RNA 2',3'-cyclic 3'-phosphodiesterase
MRLFAALVPPPEALAHLAEFLEPRMDAWDELRWTDQEQWHVTLAFMPDVPDRSYDGLVERLARAAHRHTPVTLALADAGAFPSPSYARVLWTGVTDEEEKARPLARSVRGAGTKAGAAPKGGPFHPHVTLARFRAPTEATRWLRTLGTYAGPAWRAHELVLVESHLGQGRGHRPRYEVRETFPLGASGQPARDT